MGTGGVEYRARRSGHCSAGNAGDGYLRLGFGFFGANGSDGRVTVERGAGREVLRAVGSGADVPVVLPVEEEVDAAVADSAEVVGGVVVVDESEESVTVVLERSLPDIVDVFDAASLEVPVFAEVSAAEVSMLMESVGIAGS